MFAIAKYKSQIYEVVRIIVRGFRDKLQYDYATKLGVPKYQILNKK